MMSYFLILFFCLLATSLCEESCQVSMENFNGGLVHPLLEQMKDVNIKRYKDFDEEDMDTYMQVSHEDIHVEVYVHDKLILGADGFEDYREKFNNVLQYFKNDRKIDGFHTVTLANYTLNIDGSVIINLNYKMHERPKANPNAEKIWKSSGYYINHWVPLQKGSLKLQDWKIKNYYVYVVNTSDNFGAEEKAACDDLC